MYGVMVSQIAVEINTEYMALWVISGLIYSEIASVLATGLPGIVLVHIIVAGATTGLGLNTLTGCAPISVDLMENTIVPVMFAVVVRVIVDTICSAAGEVKFVGTLSHTCMVYTPVDKLLTLIEADNPTILPAPPVT